jgi:hypothetical protein
MTRDLDAVDAQRRAVAVVNDEFDFAFGCELMRGDFEIFGRESLVLDAEQRVRRVQERGHPLEHQFGRVNAHGSEQHIRAAEIEREAGGALVLGAGSNRRRVRHGAQLRQLAHDLRAREGDGPVAGIVDGDAEMCPRRRCDRQPQTFRAVLAAEHFAAAERLPRRAVAAGFERGGFDEVFAVGLQHQFLDREGVRRLKFEHGGGRIQRGLEADGSDARRTHGARQGDDVGRFDTGGIDDTQIVKRRSAGRA